MLEPSFLGRQRQAWGNQGSQEVMPRIPGALPHRDNWSLENWGVALLLTGIHSGKLLLGTDSMPEPRPSTGDAKNWVPTPALRDLVRGTVLTRYVQRQNPSYSEGGPRLVRPARAIREEGRHKEPGVSSKTMTQRNPQYFLSVCLE